MTKPIQKRHCNYCGKYYEGFGPRFCSTQCYYMWTRVHPKQLTPKRFWSKAQITDLLKCWIWTGTKTLDGYGSIKICYKTKHAHRVVWELCYGPIPKGQSVLHHCDKPACVQPNHLFLGTQQDNIADMDNKNRRGSIKGIKNGRSKLTEKNVLDIRSLAKQGILYKDIIETLSIDISLPQIGSIVKRRSWKHI